ncbi:hypothetical protein IFT54_08255 [Sphingomonas sp. CFBP 13714]|uniref:hypothetical protein n=1 Tax=Sphingomonas sp. CFBP 13714 TaxID=2775308 RepID=UPI0017836171|nr:hypothetical protein [Sphingomonas sp. CFBP 13714]MBD8699805.1 hypothetical protein [Sphingomonas sp. CFBP 13714]
MSIHDSSPRLEVGFVIDTGDSFGGLTQLQAAMDSTEAKVLADATRIERATRGMVDVSAATSNVVMFGNAASREMQTARQAMASTEKAGEALSRQLDRQASTFGKTREEIRAMKVETAALAAEENKLVELSGRLRGQQQALANTEADAARTAAAAIEAEAQSVRSAALAHGLFEAAARRGVAAMREMEAAQNAAAATAEATRVREAAHAYAMFESAARKGAAALRELEVAQAASASDAEAQRLRSAALGHAQFEAAVHRGAQAMREQEAAAATDAASLARLRAMLDPAAAAQARLNSEIAEARRVMTAAGASAEELARAEGMLIDRANVATQTHVAMAGAAAKNGTALKSIAVQLPDITQGLLAGQKPMQVFIQQGAQILQVAQMGQGGLRGFGKEVAVLALRFSPLLIGLAAAGAGFALFNRWVNEGVKSDQLTRDLGQITGGANATKAELYKLKEETITWADTSKALFSVVGKDISDYFVGDMKGMSKGVKGVLDDLTSYMRSTLASIYAGVAGTKAYLAEVEKGGALGIGKMLIGQGDPKLLEKTYGAAYTAADTYLTKLGKRVKTAAIDNARERIAKSIGYNNIPNPKTDKHAEQLARDAAAIEAQIRNLYQLADAYGVSGAAALIAEARVKAESKAIRQRGDIEAAVAREVRLAVAQHVSDAAKSTATMREQADIQDQVNASVAAGITPTEKAAELLRDRITDLPLLAAIEAAQLTEDVDGAARASKALDDQRAARDRLTDSEMKAAIQLAMPAGDRRLAELAEEIKLIDATDAARVHSLAILRATQEAESKGWTGADSAAWIAQQVKVADEAERLGAMQRSYNDSLTFTADKWDIIAGKVQSAGQGMADAFGEAGRAIGDMASIYASYQADRTRAEAEHLAAIKAAGADQSQILRENARFALRSSGAQVQAFGDATSAAKGFFKEGSSGYQALATAEKAFRLVQFAMSVRAIAQDAIETGSKIANSVARIAVGATEAVVNAIKSLPFPLNIAAGAATVAALAGIGVSLAGSFGSSKSDLAPTNTGTGTVLGDPSAKSESIRNAIDALKDVDTVMLSYSRDMAASLKSIDSQIGGVATLVVRAGNIDANAGVTTGFKSNATATMAGIGMAIGGPIGAGIGAVLTKIPVIGSLLSGLFGTKTSVIGNGLSGGPQSVGSILNSGFDASYYSDVKKKSSFLGISTGTKYSTQYDAADAGLENQFTLILRQFNDAIVASAGPLGAATGDIQNRLNSFVVNIGKIDLKDLTGEQIQEKLTAIFGAAADGMAAAAFPAVAQFQKVGEGTFETLVRVASTVEAVGASLDLLGTSAQTMGIAAKLGLADQFDSVSALTSAADAYFESFYTKEEQAAAKTAQFAGVFSSLGMAMPETLAGFRQLVEAQDLTSAAGQATYATLLQLAPAFADLQASMEGAKSAADIASERQDLQRQLLELRGDTAALRALDLAKLDASNRDLQQEIYAVQDAQAAASAAKTLADAWTSVGDSIMDEVNRIRGVTDAAGGNGFAALQGQFNAASTAARGGDQDAAKTLPALSQALLTAAAEQATSRQELERVGAMTAASLEATYGVISALGNGATAPTAEQTTSRQELDRVQAMNNASRQAAYGVVSALAGGTAASGRAATPIDTMITAADAATGKAPAPANDDLIVSAIEALQEEVAGLRRENGSAQTEIARNTKGIDRKLDDVTADHNGMAFSVGNASAA